MEASFLNFLIQAATAALAAEVCRFLPAQTTNPVALKTVAALIAPHHPETPFCQYSRAR
jgi:hypothetical protein